MTPTRANWLAPVKTSSDRAQVCATESPEATETAPKPTPYGPVAMPTPRLSRMIDERSAGSRGSAVTRQRLVAAHPDGARPVVEVVQQHVAEPDPGEGAPQRARGGSGGESR